MKKAIQSFAWWKIVLFLLVILGIATGFISIYLYYKYFHNNGLSNQTQKWAEFGEYFGGVLNAVFAFINICITVWIAILVNRFTEKNSEKQIAVQKQISTIQLRHEILKELRTESEVSFKVWRSNILSKEYASKYFDHFLNFALHYNYLFDQETNHLCTNIYFKRNEIITEMEKGNEKIVQELVKEIRIDRIGFFAKIGSKIIQ